MKLIRMFGLLAVAAAALMAFAASASATTVTANNTGTTYTSTITAVAEEPVTLHGSFVSVTCKQSHVEGKIESHGVGTTAKGNLSTLSFGECNFPVTVLEEAAPNPKFGSLEVHAVNTDAVNGVSTCTTGIHTCQGTLTATGQKVRIHTSVGACTFRTTSTDIGVLTTTAQTGGTATLDIGAHGTGIIPRTEGSFLCGPNGQWTGSYEVTSPDKLWLDH